MQMKSYNRQLYFLIFLLSIALGNNSLCNAQNTEAIAQKNFDADKAWSSGNRNDAVRLYIESIQLSAKQIIPYQRLGYFFAEKGMLDRALSYLDKGIEANPAETLFFQRAGIHFSQNNYALAKADYEATARLSPDDLHSYANAALCAFYLNEKDPTRYFDQAEGVTTIPRPELWLRRGVYFAAGPGDYINAKIWFDKIFQSGQFPEFSATDLNLIGITCYKNKEYSNAEKMFAASLERKTDPDVMGNLASVYVDQEDWKRLLGLSKIMVDNYPRHDMANAYYGIALIRTGDTVKGNEYMRKAEALQQEQQ